MEATCDRRVGCGSGAAMPGVSADHLHLHCWHQVALPRTGDSAHLQLRVPRGESTVWRADGEASRVEDIANNE